MFKSP